MAGLQLSLAEYHAHTLHASTTKFPWLVTRALCLPSLAMAIERPPFALNARPGPPGIRSVPCAPFPLTKHNGLCVSTTCHQQPGDIIPIGSNCNVLKDLKDVFCYASVQVII